MRSNPKPEATIASQQPKESGWRPPKKPKQAKSPSARGRKPRKPKYQPPTGARELGQEWRRTQAHEERGATLLEQALQTAQEALGQVAPNLTNRVQRVGLYEEIGEAKLLRWAQMLLLDAADGLRIRAELAERQGREAGGL